MYDFDYTIDAVIIFLLMACVVLAVVAIKKHVSFKWWVYRRAIKKSRKKEWEAYVDYYNGAAGPEKWMHLLHVTELLRRRRDLERWNQWVPERDAKRGAELVVNHISISQTTPEISKSSTAVRNAKVCLETNTLEETPRQVLLDMLESYAILLDNHGEPDVH